MSASESAGNEQVNQNVTAVRDVLEELQLTVTRGSDQLLQFALRTYRELRQANEKLRNAVEGRRRSEIELEGAQSRLQQSEEEVASLKERVNALIEKTEEVRAETEEQMQGADAMVRDRQRRREVLETGYAAKSQDLLEAMAKLDFAGNRPPSYTNQAVQTEGVITDAIAEAERQTYESKVRQVKLELRKNAVKFLKARTTVRLLEKRARDAEALVELIETRQGTPMAPSIDRGCQTEATNVLDVTKIVLEMEKEQSSEDDYLSASEGSESVVLSTSISDAVNVEMDISAFDNTDAGDTAQRAIAQISPSMKTGRANRRKKRKLLQASK